MPPSVVDEMDMREINDLMDYWRDHPPAHVALRNLESYVMAKFGDKRTQPNEQMVKPTAEHLAAVFGLKMPAKVEEKHGDS